MPIVVSLRRYRRPDSASHLTTDRPKPQSRAGYGASKARSGRRVSSTRIVDDDVSQELPRSALFVRGLVILGGLRDLTCGDIAPLHRRGIGKPRLRGFLN